MNISTVFDIRNYGAVGDGVTVNTTAIQSAINTASAAGGGTVLVAGGRYVTGTLHLKDAITLHVAGGAVLLGSPRIGDYTTDTYKTMYRGEPHMNRCLLFARDAQTLTIEGRGEIDGQGNSFPNLGDPEHHRPMLIRFVNCSNIRLREISLLNPASWTTAWLYCREIVVDGIRIHSRANHNGDGLDFDGCQDVHVSNSSFDTSDDSICLQASRTDRSCRSITVTNCTFRSHWAGMRIGLLSRGDIEDVAVNNCVFSDIDDSGLKIQLCEGGRMQNMRFTNLVMHNVPRPIFMTFNQLHACVDAPDDLAPMNVIRQFVFDGLVVDNRILGKDSLIVITGMPDHPIEDVWFSNLMMISGGGGLAEDANARTLPEFGGDTMQGWWPEYHNFGRPAPAYAFYARHVSGISLTNVHFACEQPDLRPALVCEDVEQLDLNAVQMQAHPQAEACIRFQQVQHAFIHGCRMQGESRVFLRLEGAQSTDVSLLDNSLNGSLQLVSRAPEVSSLQ